MYAVDDISANSSHTFEGKLLERTKDGITEGNKLVWFYVPRYTKRRDELIHPEKEASQQTRLPRGEASLLPA